MKIFNPTHIETATPLPETVLGFHKLLDLYMPALGQVPDHQGNKDDIHFQFIYFNNPNMKERKPW